MTSNFSNFVCVSLLLVFDAVYIFGREAIVTTFHTCISTSFVRFLRAFDFDELITNVLFAWHPCQRNGMWWTFGVGGQNSTSTSGIHTSFYEEIITEEGPAKDRNV